MSRLLSLETEVLGSPHQSRSETLLPQPVDGHPRRQRMRRIGQEARTDMERMFDSKIMLRLWVKVKRGWADSDRALKSLGMNDL